MGAERAARRIEKVLMAFAKDVNGGQYLEFVSHIVLPLVIREVTAAK